MRQTQTSVRIRCDVNLSAGTWLRVDLYNLSMGTDHQPTISAAIEIIDVLFSNHKSPYYLANLRAMYGMRLARD